MISSGKAEKEKVADVDFIVGCAPKPGAISGKSDPSLMMLLQSAVDTICKSNDSFLVAQSFRVFEAWGLNGITQTIFH